MAGYAVIARIEHVDPHLAGRERASAGSAAVSEPLESGQPIDLVGRPLDAGHPERWTRLRAAWAQTTFYLFDPEGWR
jgi:hypothetical protein